MASVCFGLGRAVLSQNWSWAGGELAYWARLALGRTPTSQNRVSEESETEEEPPVAKLVFFLEYAAELRTIVLRKSQLKICYTICGRLDAR
jgi:hypothetical protein